MAENIQTEHSTNGGEGVNQRPTSGPSRLAGFTVFASVALPILAAYVVFYTGIGMPSSTVNQGELLKPAQQVAELDLIERDGQRINLSDAEPRWRYLIVADEKCAGECEKLLYTTRQVHIRLAEKASRVERLLVTGEPLTELRHGELAGQHPLLRFSSVDMQQVDQWLADSDHAQLVRPSVLLVDQNGFAMMVYDNRHTGNQILKDIKRLLKYSYEK
ncbi:hypothetical protein JF535_01475 [Microbulbifer salipaludis]|uniref:Cytochrome oxidase Cu insertion factor (SCO1/SenC/PrrC family) n=1 Tax=Microbulbifer salipaludis TaxID=187980 RepID=A0ABS3E2I1_9GAMM|nr:hypothetical protein [Microbulbifer salipaludis]MBN8429510.1 hypothetical protein [Microbulbifer salipaludis]